MTNILNKKKNSKLSIFSSLIIYRITLSAVYCNYVSPVFTYDGLKSEHSFRSILISWCIFFLLSPAMIDILSEKKEKYSNIILVVIILFSIIPFDILVSAGIYDNTFIIYNTFYYFILLMIYYFFSKKKELKIKTLYVKRNEANTIIKIIEVSSVLLVVYISFKYTGFRLIFNLFDVYEYRYQASQYNFPVLLSYCFSFSKAINIVFLMKSLIEKKHMKSILFIAVQVLSFGIDGHKTTLFMVVLAMIIYHFYKKTSYVVFKKLLIIGDILVCVLVVLENIILTTNHISEIIIRRVFFVPAQLNQYYVTFFSNNQPDFFRGSFLRFFGQISPYENIGKEIGKVFFNKPQMNCNNGLVADAVTNIGSIGIIFMPILLVIILHIMDKITCKIDSRLYVISAMYIGLVLINTFLFTTLLTHGMIISGIIFYLMSSEFYSNYNTSLRKW